MSRTPKAEFVLNQDKTLYEPVEVKKSVKLILPPAHPRQHYFITTLERDPKVRFVVGACGTKFGKGLSLSSLISTPSGFKTMAEIKVGDYVHDADGKPTRVEYVTEPMYNHKVYDVVFSDGSVVRTDDVHPWETQTHACRKNMARAASEKDRCKSTTFTPTVVSTEEIKATLTVNMGGKERPNHSIEVVSGPVVFDTQKLPVDPYILGYWLGNGSKSTSSIACGTDDYVSVAAQFESAGFAVSPYHGAGRVFTAYSLVGCLKSAGVCDNKHIPKQYLIGDVQQRLSLLQGLLDSDGTIGKRGDCMFDNTNKDLADGVAILAASLGMKVSREERQGKLNGVNKKWCYRVFFTPHLPVFRLQRKLDRIRPVAAKALRRYIVDVVEVPTEPVKCIRVASPRHLYLTGLSFIPTHNTYGSTIAMAKRAWDHKGSLNWWVAPTYKQAEMAYDLIKRLLPEGAYKEYKAVLKLAILSPDGSEHSAIEFKSGDNPDSLRGFGVNFFVMDEAARIPYQSFLSLFTTVTQTEGKGFFISTPKGRGWFYDIYQKGIKEYDDGTKIYGPDNPDMNPEWFSVRLPTWTSPHVTEKAVQDMKNNLPEDDFHQEVGAQFMLESAGVFRNIKACIKGLKQHPIPGRRYVMGVDLARLRDFSVLTVMDMKSKHVVYHDRFNQMSWEVQERKMLEVAKRYNNALTYMDATGIGDPIVETMTRAGMRIVPYKITGSTAKQQLIDKLRVNIENENISFPPIRELISELESYEMRVTDSGVAQFSAPSGKHDDCVISLALAVWGVDTVPFIYSYKNIRGI